MSEAERSFTAAWWIVDHLVRFGVRQACVSPGSRSTPVALALWRHPAVRVHVQLDERASGFFALGIAKASGRPVAVACTSGTAVAELVPAVVEASMSCETLLLLTADRPPELRGVGANQTIEQPGIFGRYVRACVELPVLGEELPAERWDELVGEATRASMGPPPGPVHLNLPVREPLVPGPVPLPAAEPSDVLFSISEEAEPAELAALAEVLGSSERGLILAGSLREIPSELDALAERVRWPLLAEPTSGWRRSGALAAGQHLIADAAFLERHVPDVVLQVGAAPTSRAGLELVRRAGTLVVLDPDHLVADPHRRASSSVRADLGALVPDLRRAAEPRTETPWWRAWHDADTSARRAVDAVLDASDEPSEGRVARDVAASLPDGSTLFVGSSLPVRDLDAYMAPRGGLDIVANRGASGIDGSVATALGIAAASDGPVAALIGDLAFAYDAGALLWNARRGVDAVLVVVNNDGGGIFPLLAQRELPELEDLFVTPHRLDLAALCSAAGAAHSRVTRASELAPAIEAARERGGVGVVEVPVDRALGGRMRDRVRAAVAGSIEP